MNFFEILISPFIFFIEQVFLFSYNISGNYGIAIILLSFSVSLLLLPIFMFIEKSKKKDDAIKQKMQPLVDEIKRCYKGQERYYYIKTINRQHNYSSIRALIPILSLLIQIPFFIAAYQFLENFADLKEVPFGFITDLSLPDGLFGVVNILPILMTLVNLLTAYFYTRNGNVMERKQMLVIAIVFLVLLFNLPSGLVLYWTMNNVFSFLRMFITNPEVFKKSDRVFDFAKYVSEFKSIIPKLKIVFASLFILSVLSQLYWAFEYNFDDIYFRLFGALLVSVFLSFLMGVLIVLHYVNRELISKISVKPRVFYSLVLLSVYFYLASSFYYSGENIALAIIAFVALVITEIVGYSYTLRFVKNASKYKFILVVLKLVFIYQLLVFIWIFIEKDITFTLLNIRVEIANITLIDSLFVGLIFMFITIPFYGILHKQEPKLNNKPFHLLYFLSVLFVTGLVLFWHPIIVYSSYPSIFNFPIIEIFNNNITLFIITIGVWIMLYLIAPKKVKNGLVIFSFIISILSFVYTIIIPLNLGTLQVNVFTEHNNLSAPILLFILEASFILALIYFSIKFFTKVNYKKYLIVIVLINISVIGQSLYYGVKTENFFTLDSRVYNENSDLKDSEITFSKTNKNVVVLMLDGFQGWYLNQVINEKSVLQDSLNGFIWYPNSISASNFTHSSMPSIMRGFDYSVKNLNKDKTRTIEEKITNTCELFVEEAHSQNYNFISTVMHHSKIDKNKYDAYLPSWDEEWDSKLNLEKMEEIWYDRLWENALLYCSPLFLKPKIYNNSNWISGYFINEEDTIGKGQNVKAKNSSLMQRYNFLRVLPRISNTYGSKGSFIYIHSMAPHIPLNTITDNGILNDKVSAYENNKWVLLKIKEWTDWMKENDVYDNTKIILVSDHGVSWNFYNGDKPKDVIITEDEKDKNKLEENEFWRVNVLLMVKDYNKRNKLDKNWNIMSNSDVHSFAFNKEIDKNIDSNGARILPSVFLKWSGTILTDTTFNVVKSFDVKGSMFDLNNWKRVDNNK